MHVDFFMYVDSIMFVHVEFFLTLTLTFDFDTWSYMQCECMMVCKWTDSNGDLTFKKVRRKEPLRVSEEVFCGFKPPA